MPVIGLQTAGSVLVGQSIGALDIPSAKRYQIIVQLFGILISLTVGSIIYFCRGLITHYYTNIDEVIELTDVLLQFLAVFHQFDALQGVSGGILRGLGKTTHASVASGISYWVISLPMEYILAFKLNYGVLGLWMGQLFGSTFHAVCQTYLVMFHFGDWRKLAEEARESIEQENKRLEARKMLIVQKQTEMSEVN